MKERRFLLLLLLAVCASLSVEVLPVLGDCDANRVAMYRLTLETLWDPRIFPKQYPQWGPAAAWSKVVGERGRLLL